MHILMKLSAHRFAHMCVLRRCEGSPICACVTRPVCMHAHTSCLCHPSTTVNQSSDTLCALFHNRSGSSTPTRMSSMTFTGTRTRIAPSQRMSQTPGTEARLRREVYIWLFLFVCKRTVYLYIWTTCVYVLYVYMHVCIYTHICTIRHTHIWDTHLHAPLALVPV